MAEKVEKKHTNLEDTFSITMELQRPLLKDEDDENEEIIKQLRIDVQKEYEKEHTREEFIKIIGKSYIDNEG